MAKNDSDISGWVGWIGFASVMLYLAGFFHLIAGFAALFSDKVYVEGPQAFWILDVTQLGWVYIIGGLLAIWAASSLVQGNTFGRTVAILVALGSAIANMAFIPIYPIWSLLMVTVDIFIIYAVVVHGGELKEK